MENQIPAQPAPLPVEESKPQVYEQKPNNFLVILLSILLLLAISIAGFFAFQTQKLVSELQVMSGELKQATESTAESTFAPIISSDSMADWEVYINDKYGFSIKYPSEWTVIFSEKDSGFEEKNLNISSGSYSINFDWTSAGYGGVICKFNDSTSDEFAGPGLDNLYEPYILGTLLGKDLRRNSDPILQLDQYGYQKNELGYTFRACTKMNGLRSDGKSAYEGAIGTKLGTLEITYETPRSNINNSILTTIDQILSTFKFID